MEVLSVVSVLCGVAGIVGVFTDNWVLMIVGAGVDIVDNILNVFMGRQNNIVSVILFPAVCAFIFTPFWKGILAGLCFESVAMGALSLVVIFISYLKERKEIKRRLYGV